MTGQTGRISQTGQTNKLVRPTDWSGRQTGQADRLVRPTDWSGRQTGQADKLFIHVRVNIKGPERFGKRTVKFLGNTVCNNLFLEEL